MHYKTILKCYKKVDAKVETCGRINLNGDLFVSNKCPKEVIFYVCVIFLYSVCCTLYIYSYVNVLYCNVTIMYCIWAKKVKCIAQSITEAFDRVLTHA